MTRLSANTARLVPGDAVDVAITRAGGSGEPIVGYLPGVVEHAGIEVDVRLLLSDGDEARGIDADDAEAILDAAGADLSLDDLIDGPIYLLRNCQPEQVALVPTSLSREVSEALRLRIHDSHLVEAIAIRLGVER